MDQCPYCQSDRLENISSSQIGRSYEKTESNRTSYGTRYYVLNEILCHDCGCVHKKMTKPNLVKYLEDQPYFKFF